jgi:hypothetical protein
MKILKKIYNWAKNKMPPRENPQSIASWINWLNTNYGPGTWIRINGYMALIRSIPGPNHTATYDTTFGYPLISFVNQQTGEVKSFDAGKFYV